MGDEDQRGAETVEVFGQHGDDLGSGDAVQVAGGFVGEKDLRAVDQAAGDGGALALASGQLAGAMVQSIAQTDRFEGGNRHGPAAGGRESGQHQRQLDVL